MIAMTAAVLMAATALAVPTTGTPLRADLDALVAAGSPGAVLTVRHGTRTQRLAAGYADLGERRPMRVEDRFRGGSQMKSVTAAVVLQLAEERLLRLDDPVDRLIPGVIPHGYGRGVTVRHLLQNTSGLENFNNDPRVLAPYLAGDLGHVWTPQQLLDIAFEHPPVFPPGTGFHYSDTNFFLAAYVVEAVTGHSFDHELRTRILRPLHLRDTDLPTTTRIWGRHAHGYFDLGDPPVLTDLTAMYPWAWAAGGMNTTVADSAAFYRALLGGRLIGPRMLRELRHTVPDPDSDLPTGYSLGLQRWTPCGEAWGHSGNTPGYLVYTWVSPDLRHEVVLMVNKDPRSLGAAVMAQYNALLIRAFCER